MGITRIPIGGSSGQTPTCAMQFEKDWPGLFIRGDVAILVATAIRRLQSQLQNTTNVEIALALRALDDVATMIENDVVARIDDQTLPPDQTTEIRHSPDRS